MNRILEGKVLINGTDIWKEYGAFLTEEKAGGRENQTALMTPSKAKSHVGVNIREENGVKYSERLTVSNEEREITLHFALFAASREEWLRRYRGFIAFLKEGADGWLEMEFPDLDLKIRAYYMESTNYKPLTYLSGAGVQASRFKVKFKEPEPAL